MVKCAIVDDEALARKLLTNYVGKIPELTLVATCQNAIEAQSLLQQQEIDLLFLDIQMPDLTGIELLKAVKKPPLTILTTAYSDYALEGYSLDVIDYLLKPISFGRFFQAVSKALAFLHHPVVGSSEGESEAGPPMLSATDYFFVKSDYKIVKVNFSEVLFIEGMREYVRIHTEAQKIMTLLSMQKLEEMLPSSIFTRIHRSHIVNVSKISEVQGNTVYISDVQLPVSKSYKEAFLQQINHFNTF